MSTSGKRKREEQSKAEEEEEVQEMEPAKRGRGRPKKTAEQQQEDKELLREEEEKEEEEEAVDHATASADGTAGGDSDLDENQQWLLKVLEYEHLQSLAKETVSDKHTTLKEYEAAFARIGNRLLNETVLLINGQPHRLAEIELYYEGGNHHDTFTHCDTLQQTAGNWYFHKSGASYKGGSYKGLDITFGGQMGADGKKAFGGILIRAIEPLGEAGRPESDSGSEEEEDGGKKGKAKGKGKAAKGGAKGGGPDIIEGPSLVVDHVLSLCKADSIVSFVAKDYPKHQDSPPAHFIAGRKLYLAPVSAVAETTLLPLTVHASPRVGLTLKKVREDGETFIMKAYRYFVYPSLMKKGKVYMICALHFVDGLSVADIQQVSKTGKATIENYVRDFKAGQALKSASSFHNVNLTTAQLCKLYGAVSTLV